MELSSKLIGVIGDIHIGNLENQENFVNYQMNSLEYYFQELTAHTNTIVFLGDLLHNRKHITQISLNNLQNKFEKLIEKYNIQPIFICGNHDVYYRSSNELCTLKFLLNKPNYKVVIDDCEVLTYNGTKYATCVPWINAQNSKKLIEQFTSHRCPYLFGHFEISGHDVLPGIKSLHDQFDTELLMPFREVISGHFHCSSRHANVSYLGAPLEMNWSDSENKKKVMLLDLEKGVETFFFNPYTFFDKIQLNGDSLPELEQYRNKNVKIYLNVKRSIRIEKFIAALTEIANSCNIIDNTAILEENDVEISINKRMGILDIWNEYIDQTAYEKSDKIELTKIFTETYNSVLMENIK